MRIENVYARNLKAQESLNVSLHAARGAEFALLLSLMGATLYAPDMGDSDLEPDEFMRELACLVNAEMGLAFYNGDGAYFSWLRALSEEYPMLQHLTAMKSKDAPSPHQVASTYAANAMPDTQTVVQQINQIRTAA